MTRGLLDRFDPKAEAALRHTIGGAVRTQAVYVAATLGVADKLALGPRDVRELADGVDAAVLRRVLRFLVSSGVFIETEDGRFALNSPAEYLQTAHPRSMRKSAIRAGESLWSTSARLLDIVKTGSIPHDYFDRATSSFDARMSFSAADLGAAISAHECFANVRSVVDVGGGKGAHLAAMLRVHPHLHGILFDRPAVVADVLLERSEVVAGDFFESVPRGDVYVLSWILHDWDDEHAARILRACHHDGATLLIAEVLLPSRAEEIRDSSTITDPFTLDMQMLLLTGGRERTLDEYRALLDANGFELTDARTTESTRGASILTARAK